MIIRICYLLWNRWYVLDQEKWNHNVVLTELPLKIDLLSRLHHANRGENVFCGRRRIAEERQRRERQANDERMTKCEWHFLHLNIRAAFVTRHSCFVIVPHLFIKG